MGKLSSRLALPIGMLDLSDKGKTAYTDTPAQPGATPSSNFQLARLGMEHSCSSCVRAFELAGIGCTRLKHDISWTLLATKE